MSHFVECNIKAWEGADNPPPWCNCQTIAEVEIKAQRDMLAKCIAAVRWVELISAAGEYLSRRGVLAALRALQP
jgi:hypothetical protein